MLLQPILVFYSGATQNDFTLTFRAVNISSAADLLTSPDSTAAFIATPGKCQMMEQKLYHVCIYILERIVSIEIVSCQACG